MNLSTDDCDMIVTTVNMYDKTSLLSAITTGILLIIAALFCTTGLYCNLLLIDLEYGMNIMPLKLLLLSLALIYQCIPGIPGVQPTRVSISFTQENLTPEIYF